MTTFEQPPVDNDQDSTDTVYPDGTLKFPERFESRPKPASKPAAPPPPPAPTFSPDDAKNIILVLRRAPLQSLDEADFVRESLIRFINHVNAFFEPTKAP